MKKLLLFISIFTLLNMKLFAQCDDYGQLSGNITGTHGANFLLGQKFTTATANDITALGINSQTSGQQVIMALYTDNAGAPGTLITQSASTTLSFGDNIIDVPDVPINAGDYWIMKVLDGTNATITESDSGASLTHFTSLSFGETLPINYPVGSSYSDDIFATWMVVCPATLGIIENNFKNDLVIFPNPTQGDFSIDLKKTYSNISVRIVNVNGQVIHSKNYTNSNKLDLNINNSSGIYLIEISNENMQKAVFRIIKK